MPCSFKLVYIFCLYVLKELIIVIKTVIIIKATTCYIILY